MYLFSRGLPQGEWTTYFHFTNSHISMSWLWFLPVLFCFEVAYVLLARLRLPVHRLSLPWAVMGVLLLSSGYSIAVGELGWTGWTKTPLVDFQNERLLPYFLVFLLGAFCYRRKVLDPAKRNMKLYIAVNATAWLPLNVYVVVLLNFFLHPGSYIISAHIDGMLLWCSSQLSMLTLLYCAVTTFKYFFNRQRSLGASLGRLSYNVYIIHVVVLGALAMALLETDLPALAKYPLLTVTAYVISNLLVWVWARTRERLTTRRAVLKEATPAPVI